MSYPPDPFAIGQRVALRIPMHFPTTCPVARPAGSLATVLNTAIHWNAWFVEIRFDAPEKPRRVCVGAGALMPAREARDTP